MALFNYLSAFILVIHWICCSAHFGKFSQEYKYSVSLGERYNLHLHWTLDYTQRLIFFKLVVRTFHVPGFAFGFSPSGSVENADFAVYWTESNELYRFEDGWTDEKGVLYPDSSQDLNLHLVSSSPQLTVLEFSRPFATCDTQDYQIDNGTTNLVYVVFDKWNPGMQVPWKIETSILYHGMERVQLLKPDVPKPIMPQDVWQFTVTAPKVEVPARETTYWWYTTQLPNLPTKQHIIKYEGIIADGSETFVHHIEVFHCEDIKGAMPFFNGPGMKAEKPAGLSGCKKVIGAWAMGAGAIAYPDEAGSPIGGPGFTPHVVLEVHYNNPRRLKGHVDQSGIRFYVTPTLRRYDAGIMELGLEYTDKMAIPPGQAAFTLSGYCIKECTEVGLPSSGIHIFASQLHTHLTGRKVFTRHFRGEDELPEINRDNHYSPHFQEIRVLPVPVHVLPGDVLVTSCEYNTVSRNKVTVGGLAISDEMCVNYIHYYPLCDLEVCKSSVETHSLQSFFSFMHNMELDATNLKQSARVNYKALSWTPLDTHLLRYLYNNSPLAMQCNRSNGQRFQGSWEHSHPPRIVPYVAISELC